MHEQPHPADSAPQPEPAASTAPSVSPSSAPADAARAERAARPLHPVAILMNMLRGGLIGMAELVPGVSGGTIALIVGVYERLIASGSHVIDAVKQLLLGPDRRSWWRTALQAEWTLIIPLVVGMALTVFTMAGVMEAFVTGSPQLSRGLFLGMVAVSVAVPLLLIDRRDLATGPQKLRALVLVAAVAAVFFVLTGLGGAAVITDPPMLLVYAAAAVAICALVLPGVSGSFFLLTIGIYAPTVAAVSDRNLGYLAVFALGALTGLALFVKLLHWLLEHHHSAVMLVMAGLMLGSLRALWPWQGEQRQLHAPGDDLLPVVGLAVLGAVIVLVLILVDRTLSARVEATEPQAEGATPS